eukprot:gb/GEZN01005338.1/.p1 GENE.gb/GEZN01005338.1/~~gb/GEZN01005338.1/.p1  ORF type:complete len:550 (-),score=126.72 gb/GEZN01005338.1/:106-1755(-)
MSALSIFGDRVSGQDVRSQNVMAAEAIANIVKSSLGPVGLDKMLVDQVGDVIISNDGATILQHLEVEHPAAKVLVELSNLQDQEVGDGTTSVVILAAELLKVANEMVKRKVHPTSIISGFQLAKKEACKFVAQHMTKSTDELPQEAFINVAKTSISSKIIGAEADFFGKLAYDAVKAVKVESNKKDGGGAKYPLSAITVLKAHGKSARESELVNGFALNATKAAQGMPSVVKKAKIALLDMDLRTTKLPLGVEVRVTDPEKLEQIRSKEKEITKNRIKLLLEAGANFILTTQGIDDMALKLFVEAGAIACRRVAKADLRGLAKATGATVLLSLANEMGDESFDVKSLGYAESVEETRVGDGELLYIRGCKSTSAQTIILRGANDFMLDEIDRSLHDAMSAVKRVLESKKVVPGGGAVEAALSVHLEHLADTMGSRQQLAVAAFAQALLVIPKTLATNGAFDAVELVARLRAYHNAAQLQTKTAKVEYKWTGLDLVKGKIRNNLKAGVLEPALSKIKMLKFATEAAITILRIDDAIKMHPDPVPEDPHGH